MNNKMKISVLFQILNVVTAATISTTYSKLAAVTTKTAVSSSIAIPACVLACVGQIGRTCAKGVRDYDCICNQQNKETTLCLKTKCPQVPVNNLQDALMSFESLCKEQRDAVCKDGVSNATTSMKNLEPPSSSTRHHSAQTTDGENHYGKTVAPSTKRSGVAGFESNMGTTDTSRNTKQLSKRQDEPRTVTVAKVSTLASLTTLVAPVPSSLVSTTITDTVFEPMPSTIIGEGVGTISSYDGPQSYGNELKGSTESGIAQASSNDSKKNSRPFSQWFLMALTVVFSIV